MVELELERQGHEVLSVERTHNAVVKRHFALYAHLRLSMPEPVSVGQDVPLAVSLVAWDTDELVTDMDRTVKVFVDDVLVNEVSLVAGAATLVLQFTDADSYTLKAGAEAAQPVELEVTVR